MLRDAHTLKGSSRMVGLIEISDVAHRLEDIMVKVRDQELAYIPEMSDCFFEALDTIVFLTDNSGVNTDAAIDLDALKVRLAAIAASGTDAAETAASGCLAATAARPVVRRQPMMRWTPMSPTTVSRPTAMPTLTNRPGSSPIARSPMRCSGPRCSRPSGCEPRRSTICST